uniref:CSON009993 protein n=1 Tax=Culicoides sonorensis TaxID=179676 RepID=A0A336LH35_CULSO
MSKPNSIRISRAISGSKNDFKSSSFDIIVVSCKVPGKLGLLEIFEDYQITQNYWVQDMKLSHLNLDPLDVTLRYLLFARYEVQDTNLELFVTQRALKMTHLNLDLLDLTLRQLQMMLNLMSFLQILL